MVEYWKEAGENLKLKDFNPIGYGALTFPSRDDPSLSPIPYSPVQIQSER